MFFNKFILIFFCLNFCESRFGQRNDFWRLPRGIPGGRGNPGPKGRGRSEFDGKGKGKGFGPKGHRHGGKKLLEGQNDPKCGTYQDQGTVHTASDGIYNDRCYSLITPETQFKSLPILFWFHGAGGNAHDCGGARGEEGITMYELAQKNGYALICGEALQVDHPGQWDIPEVIDDNNDYCSQTASTDMVYIMDVIQNLSLDSRFDLTRIFTAGCSMGSAFSQFISGCLKMNGFDISAYATHSTGLKVKGDGLKFPGDWHSPGIMWGECDCCKYFPSRPRSWKSEGGFKACIFDNTGDGDFYTSSKNLVDIWQQYGNVAESHFLSGGHCQIHSYVDIVDCLDDGTGRLKQNSTSIKILI